RRRPQSPRVRRFRAAGRRHPSRRSTGRSSARWGHILRLAPGSSAATPIHLADTGAITFVAVLDTDLAGDGRRDSGAFRWEDGTLTLIARTGTVIEGSARSATCGGTTWRRTNEATPSSRRGSPTAARRSSAQP